jgi:hypothetical protein
MAMALLIVGAAMTAAGAINTAATNKNVADYNAKVGRQNATTVEQQAQVQAQIQSRRAYLQQGQAIAGYAANGGATSEGSPLEILQQSAQNAEADRQNIIYNGQVKATSLRNGASLDDYSGDAAMTTGYLSAAGALAGGAAKAYSGGAGTTIPVNN